MLDDSMTQKLRAMPHDGNEYLDLLKRCLTASIYEESGWKWLEPTGRKSDEPRTYSPVQYLKNCFHRWLLDYCRKRSLALVKKQPFRMDLREDGRDKPWFGYTMAGHRRLDNVQECVETVLRENIPGDLIETGVWRGGTTILMRAVLKVHGITNRTVWVADSFEGLPPGRPNVDDADLSEVEFLKVSLEQVSANFAQFGLLDDHVRFLKGWFSETLPVAPIDQLAVLRLDGDLYDSTMDALQNLYHRVSPNGFVIVDDYYAWNSCRQAVTDFCERQGLNPTMRRVDWTAVYWRVDHKS